MTVGILDLFRSPTPATRSLDEIAALVAPAPTEVRAFTSSAAIPTNGSLAYGGDSGVWVNDRSAMRHLAVWSCVRLLAGTISSLPQDVFRKRSGEVREALPSPQLLTDPNADWNDVEYMSQVVTSLALRGNSIELITRRDNLERPVEREVIHPDDVQVTKNKETRRIEYKINNVLVPSADVIHIRLLSLAGGCEGLSPIAQAAQAIGLGLAAERYGARYFGDSANPSSVLESDGNISDEAAKQAMESWVSTHGGRRLPAVLSGGLKWKPISITPEESQFLQTREFSRSEIAMFFGIPPHMIGDTSKATSWGSGIEQMSIGFVKYSLLPWLRCIEATYSRSLLPRGQYMRFNVEGLLRGDTVSRYNSYTQARNAGWLSVNEVREKEDMAPIENGDNYLQPLNYGPLGSDPLAIQPADTGGDPNAQD